MSARTLGAAEEEDGAVKGLLDRDQAEGQLRKHRFPLSLETQQQNKQIKTLKNSSLAALSQLDF